MLRAPKFILASLLIYCSADHALAQWTNQTIILHPGWNSVFLQLQPEPAACDTLFAGLPVETVWGWNRRFTTVQYIQNPADLLPGQPDWLVWASDVKIRATVNLYNLQAEQAYLIKVATNAAAFSWKIYGRPVVRNIDWFPDSFNFLGLHVDPSSPPTFQDYFAPSPAHAGQPIFRLTPSGIWSQVYPASDLPKPGEAYWVRCSGVSTYSGPLVVGVEQGRSLDYGSTLTEQTLTIKNASTTDRMVSIAQTGSSLPPSLNYPALAGPVPLSSFVMNYPTNVGFVPLPGRLTNTIPAGGTWSLRLAVRRPDMTSPPAGSTNTLYQSLLQISDGSGALQIIPVTASGVQSPNANLIAKPGLWVGTATINMVSQGSVSTPTNVASSFQFRLLVHQDTNGQANLLQHIFVAFKSGGGGTNYYGTNYPGSIVTNQAGSYVLLLDPGAQTNVYDFIIRRFASAAFGFAGTNPMTGQFGGTNQLTSTVILGYDDPTNPFKHLYHPDHDNKDDSYYGLGVVTNAGWPANQAVAGPYTSESWTVTRYLKLQFTATDLENLPLPGWGDTMVGGYYSEVITGLHKNPLSIQGTFRLHLAVNTGMLY